MEFFVEAVDTLEIMVIAIGAGLGAWGSINLLEGYGSDNPGANGQGSQGTNLERWCFVATNGIYKPFIATRHYMFLCSSISD